MKQIIETSKELTKIEKYHLTSSNSTQSIRNFENQILEIEYWARFTDTNENGGTTEILSMATKDGEFIATNSAIVMRAFDEIVEAFGDDLPPVKIFTGTSKNGRKYYNVTVA